MAQRKGQTTIYKAYT